MRASIAILIGAIILCAQAQEDLRKQFLVASVRKLSTFLYLYLHIHPLCNILVRFVPLVIDHNPGYKS